MKMLLLIAGLLTQLSAIACVKPELSHFLVYATEGIASDSTEYQGLVGSAGPVTLTNVRVRGNDEACLALSSGDELAVSDACVALPVESAREIFLQRVCGADSFRERQRTRADHRRLPRELRNLAQGYGRLPEGGTATTYRNGWRFIEAKDPVSVLNVDETFFHPNNRTVLRGGPSQTIVINVSGRAVRIQGAQIFAESISPSQVIFRFPEAEELAIRYTGTPRAGFPGLILAPRAALTFTDSFVDGRILVRRIDPPSRGERSGEVRAAAPVPRPGKKPDGRK